MVIQWIFDSVANDILQWMLLYFEVKFTICADIQGVSRVQSTARNASLASEFDSWEGKPFWHGI